MTLRVETAAAVRCPMASSPSVRAGPAVVAAERVSRDLADARPAGLSRSKSPARRLRGAARRRPESSTIGRPSRRGRAGRAARAAGRCATIRVRVADPVGLVGLERVAAGRGRACCGPTTGVAEAITLPDDPGAARQRRHRCCAANSTSPDSIARARLHVTALGLHQVSDQRAAGLGRTCSRRAGRPTATGSSPTRTTSRPAAAGARTSSRPRSATAGIGAASAGMPARRAVPLRRPGRARRPARDRARRRRADRRRDRPRLAGVDRRDPVRRPLRRERHRPARASDRLGRAGIRRQRPGARVADGAVRRRRHRATRGAAGPGRRERCRSTGRARDDGCWTLDGGQNIAGWVRLTVRGRAGDARRPFAMPRCSSPMARSTRGRCDRRGRPTRTSSPTTETTTWSRRSRSTDSGTPRSRRPPSCSTPSSWRSAATRRGAARSRAPTPRSNRLHENVVWSQRDNFVSVPTDCPQRDERLGWTGRRPGVRRHRVDAVRRRGLLAELAARPGARPGPDPRACSTVVPDVVIDGEPRFGRAGWADAATIVPWAVYEAYGDPSVLADQLDSMAPGSSPWRPAGLRRTAPLESMQFGDWLDPDAPVRPAVGGQGRLDYIANAFFVHSARLAADAADAPRRRRHSRRVRGSLRTRSRRATWDALARARRHDPDRLRGRHPARRRARRATVRAWQRPLRASSARPNGRVATGFLGTPLVLPALADVRPLRRVLPDAAPARDPSWLYQVGQGATTVWERWDAIRPDGSIHPGTMAPPPDMTGVEGRRTCCPSTTTRTARSSTGSTGTSPGSRRIAMRPGYRHVLFAPKPCVGIDWARASVESTYGPVRIAWRLARDELAAEIELPIGTTGTFDPPVTSTSSVALDDEPAERRIDLGPGRHRILVTDPALAHPGQHHASRVAASA